MAEAIGTFVLVLIGCGTCISDASWENSEPTKVQISLAFGLAVATVVWNVAHISGGHVNPAVTVAMLCARRISIVRAVLYVFAQCAGAVTGAAVLAALTPATVHGGLGTTTVSALLTKEQGFGIEAVITFVLVLTVFACCDANRTDLNGSAPLAIGLSVTLCHLFAIKYTGSSMNPARSFGPAVIGNVWTDHWVYWAGPIVGGIVAGLLYELVFSSDASLSKARSFLLSTDNRRPATSSSSDAPAVASTSDIEMQTASPDEKERLKVVEVEVSI